MGANAMKVVLIPAVAIVLLCGAGSLFAQQPSRQMTITAPSRSAASASSSASRHEDATSLEHFSMGELIPTPEMWFYEQHLREYRNPKNAVRRRAEFEADQRQQRLAAMDWYGFSNSRPTVNPMPFTGPGLYSPAWVGNSTVPYQWNGGSRQVIVAPTRPAASRSAYGLW
ncbi:MAG TPA: hypothetical protein VGJ26_09925 [Pirellulales bacterium]